MKQVQKRYIYSAVVSSIFFIVSYGVIDMNLLLTIPLTIILYIGGIFMFKEKDIREFDGEHVNNYYFMASKIANRGATLEDVTMRKHINKITTLTDQILVSLEQRPKKVEQVFDFFDYYLDITYKILYRYKNLKSKKSYTKEEKEFISNVGLYLTHILEAFEKQYKNMQEARMLDINSEIAVFEHTLGIKKSEMKVGENDE